MKAMVGSSVLPNSFEAGVELTKNTLKGIKKPKIGFLFSSTKYNQEELIKGIQTVNKDIKLIGCTSRDAIMTPEGIISSSSGFAGMLVLEDNELDVGVAVCESGSDARATGRLVATMAMKNVSKKYSPVAFMMIASSKNEEYYLKGIQDVVGELPMFGGSSSLNEEDKIFTQDKVVSDGVAVALFYTTKKIKTVFTGDYLETNNMGIVTKVENDRKVVEIDGVPALKKYSEWINTDISSLLGERLSTVSSFYPLGVKTLQGDLVAVRQPEVGNLDYSFDLGTKVVEKSAVIQLKNDVDGLIGGCSSSLKKLKEGFDPAALILFHSSSRKDALGDRIDDDFVAIRSVTSNIPFIVAFTFSEYGYLDHSGAVINDLSLSFTGFSK